MKVSKEIRMKIKNADKVIYFGVPDNDQELEEMFKFRYENYLKHKYIKKELFPDGLEKDKYDEENKCEYFIAKIDDKIIGSVRVIKDKFLPTEKECFKFKEPEAIKRIPRDKRLEIGRLISKGYMVNGKFLPRHLVMIGLIEEIVKFSFERKFLGGYSFIKKSLEGKLKKLGFPFHQIKPFTQIYSQEYLYGYFHEKKNPVSPIYYLADEDKKFLDNIFDNSKIFRKTGQRKYFLLYNNILNFLLYVKMNNLSNKLKIWK